LALNHTAGISSGPAQPHHRTPLGHFPGNDTEVLLVCYPLEEVTKFETKSTEPEDWQETGTPYLVRTGCVISLPYAICNLRSSLARITYTGGYVLPGTTPGPGQVPLPSDLEQACIEQVAFWFQNREHLGLKTYWPSGLAYHQFATFDLLDSVKATLSHYRRWSL
jgi:hypothetical protein